ncbi:MAG: PepSY domain-containing protein [Gordonia sp. (in: high G+C Gram-positive bacteria)]|uniref:PepSY-associated TM helix domain-containing protein n=1 Tax=Gordonia sp. (in: high G+C Gram-positive bacteria) TaxID=84139 RepID=UPI003C715BEE
MGSRYFCLTERHLNLSTSVSSTTPKSTPPDPSTRVGVVRLVRRLHFYAGVLIAPFLLIAAVTGALYALATTAEQVVYRHQLHSDSPGTAKSIAEQVRTAQDFRPNLKLTAVQPAANAGDTTRVLFDDPALGDSERLAVFIDPVTLELRGELVSYGSSAALPLRTWIDHLHRDLHLGEPGRLYSELAASWLWLVALGGIILWAVTVRQRRRATGTGSILRGLPNSRGRATTINKHGVIGTWVLVVLLFLSATGLTWSTYAGEHVSELRSALSWTTPSVDASLSDTPSAPAGEHADHGAAPASGAPADSPVGDSPVASIDGAVAIAKANGVDGAVEVKIPADSKTAYVVSQRRVPWQTSSSSIAVDPARDAVVDISRFADWPLAAKLSAWGISMHMGILFGWINQLALVAAMVALISLIVLGYRSWWRRRTSTTPVGAPPARGALRELPLPVAVGVLVVAAAVGWFIPLLGWPLLAFLIVDTIIGTVRNPA